MLHATLLLFPPDGAEDVPTDAQIVVAGATSVDELAVTADGVAVDGERQDLSDRTVFVPHAPFAAGASIEVALLDDGEPHLGVFSVGAGTAPAPSWVPEVDPIVAELVSPRGALARWSFTAHAEHPEADPYGYFQVVYRDAGGELEHVDALWPADGSAPGTWEDRAPSGRYCAGVGYVDVAGQYTEPVASCVDLFEPMPVGCSTTGGAALGAWALLAALATRARDRAVR